MTTTEISTSTTLQSTKVVATTSTSSVLISTTTSTSSATSTKRAFVSTTTSTTSLSLISLGQDTEVAGSLNVVVNNPIAFRSDIAQNSIKQAIADNFEGVTDDMITIVAITNVRRLKGSVNVRRLQGEVRVDYKILIPASAPVSMPTTSTMEEVEKDLKDSINNRLSQNGASDIVVTDVAASDVTSMPIGDSDPAVTVPGGNVERGVASSAKWLGTRWRYLSLCSCLFSVSQFIGGLF